MTRITTRTPSTGKPVNVVSQDIPTTYTTIADAPDFSVPDASERFEFRDPADSARAIRPGEIFFLTPLAVRNKTQVDAYVEVRILLEDNTTIEFGKLTIPAEDTGFVPVQGRSILKRDLSGSTGDQLQVQAENPNTFDVWAAGEEKLSNEHFGVVEE
jgi:hypothetical protein